MPTNTIAGARAEFRRRDYRTARTQREAGLEFFTWEYRLQPIRSWPREILAWLGGAGLATAGLSAAIAALQVTLGG